MQRSDLHWGPLLHSNPKMSVANAEKFNYCLLWSSWANIWVTSAPFLLGLLTNVTTQELYPDKELNKEQRPCFQTNPRVTGELPPAHPSSRSAAAASHHTLFLPATATSTNNFWCSNWGRDPHFSPVTRGRADTLYANSKVTCEQTPWSVSQLGEVQGLGDQERTHYSAGETSGNYDSPAQNPSDRTEMHLHLFFP